MRETNDSLPAAPEFDVVVCGGTLGIFLACSLQLRGVRVAVVERGKVQGREQEWNISRKELSELVCHAWCEGVLTFILGISKCRQT